MDPWLKLKFPKHRQIEIWTFLIVFNVSICCLSPKLGMVISKLVYFQISLVVTKWLIVVWSVQTMHPWLKLKFAKRYEIRIWTFLFVFSTLKCHLSPTLRIVMNKLVYFDIPLIVAKWLILVWRVQLWTMANTKVSKTLRYWNLDFLDYI